MTIPMFLILLSCPLWADTAPSALPQQPQTRELFQLPSIVERKSMTVDVKAQRSLAVTQAYQSTAWFQSIDLTMRYDINKNGFYSQLYVRFDAHTEYSSQSVYAIYSLIDNNGVEQIIHTSSVFTLYRQSNEDWFAIETDLQQLRTGYYKLLIELVDANTGYLLAEISGYDNHTLDRLPLEDKNRDSYIEVVVREESGGALGFFSFFALSSVYLWRRKNRFGLFQKCFTA